MMLPQVFTSSSLSLSTLQRTYYKLSFAQQKLLDCSIPLQLKALCYVRICCSAMRVLQHIGYCVTPTTAFTYLDVIRALAQHDPAWWEQCQISADGYLTSTHSAIQAQLHPINLFVAQHLQGQMSQAA